jgi:hypothetical protein
MSETALLIPEADPPILWPTAFITVLVSGATLIAMPSPRKQSRRQRPPLRPEGIVENDPASVRRKIPQRELTLSGKRTDDD